MIRTVASILLLISFSAFAADDEVGLFDARGKPVAYIAEELTIYLWSGKPVAYLESEPGKLHVYGFNGKHLGWFARGVVRDHNGDAVGAVREVFRSPVENEPYKTYKEYKPYKSYREYAPNQPSFSRDWGDLPLLLFLMRGTS